ncbi:T3SS effector cysteine hydrolase SpvD family protein [Pseudomonas sp. LB3P81]
MKVFGSAAGYGVHSLSSKFAERKLGDIGSHDLKRIQQSLHLDESPKPLPEHLSVEDLRQIARFANYTYIHYSGNCSLLSACVHYNIENNANILRCENTSSPHMALDSDVVDMFVFGDVLNLSCCFHSLEEVDKEVLRRYEVNGERSCIVGAENYVVPLIGECAHDFNAVVLLDSESKPMVQYLDSWKTSNTTPSMEELKSYFPASAYFTVRSCGGN